MGEYSDTASGVTLHSELSKTYSQQLCCDTGSDLLDVFQSNTHMEFTMNSITVCIYIYIYTYAQHMLL